MNADDAIRVLAEITEISQRCGHATYVEILERLFRGDHARARETLRALELADEIVWRGNGDLRPKGMEVPERHVDPYRGIRSH